jgi:hypothetical protein
MWDLHAVIINGIPLEEAQIISQEFIKNKNRKFYRITKNNSIRFRNISKQKFSKFRTKKLNENISLIFGLLKK